MESSILHILLSLLTLTFLEVILGIDNLVFLTVASSKLPICQQKIARRLGLIAALVTRLLLLASVVWLVGLKKPLFTILDEAFSVRDLLLLGGGLFLLYKSTQEIHQEMETAAEEAYSKLYSKMIWVIIQIGILDIIFSLDSIFTAIGLTTEYWIMATAILIAILVMIFLSEPISHFIEKNPTIKMLALSFLLLIGVMLIADAFHYHIPRGYLYFAICFSIFVELMNTIVKNRKKQRSKP